MSELPEPSNYPVNEIIKWAIARGLFGQTTTQPIRLKKLREEFDELADAIEANDRNEIIDALGDMFVVMAQIAHEENTNMLQCAWMAYEEIKYRTGKIVDGTFVKD